MTDEITLEERLAKELAGRLLGYTEGSADDIANVKDSLEDALKAADVRLCKPIKASVYVAPDTGELPKFPEEMFKTSQPIGRITDEDDEDEDDCDDEALAELEHMRSVADRPIWRSPSSRGTCTPAVTTPRGLRPPTPPRRRIGSRC